VTPTIQHDIQQVDSKFPTTDSQSPIPEHFQNSEQHQTPQHDATLDHQHHQPHQKHTQPERELLDVRLKPPKRSKSPYQPRPVEPSTSTTLMMMSPPAAGAGFGGTNEEGSSVLTA